MRLSSRRAPARWRHIGASASAVSESSASRIATWVIERAEARLHPFMDPRYLAEMDAIVRQPGHRRRIDYVFVGSWYAHPNAHCYINSAELAFDQPTDGIWASDHYGVVVDLDVGMEPSPG